MNNDLLPIKHLAAELYRGRGYVHAMVKAGFPMPGRRATLAEARAWLAAHPDFTRESVYPTKRRNVPEHLRQ